MKHRLHWPGKMAVTLAGLLALVSLKAATEHLSRAGRTVHLEIRSRGPQIVAVINGGNETVLVDSSSGTGIGVYAFVSDGGVGRAFHIRNISLTPEDGPFKGMPHRVNLTIPRECERSVIPSPNWLADPCKGLAYRGAEGTRGIAMLKTVHASDFVLEADMKDASDAGIVMRATDDHNGIVFVVRPAMNDAFFFRMVNGHPGPLSGLIPIAQLKPRRELLELANLVLGILLGAALLILCLKILLRLLPRAEMLWSIGFLRATRGARLLVPLALAAITFAVLAGVAQKAYDGIPHIDDEQAYYFQAKIFAAGRLWAPVPPAKEFFDHWHIIMDGNRWYGKYPPLYPALLSLGMMLNRPWLVNSLLGALTGLFVFLTARKLHGDACGAIAWILALSSPFFLIVGGSLMSHMTAALFIMMTIYFIIAGDEKRGTGLFMMAGISAGLAFLTRPYTATLACIPVAVFATFGVSPRRAARHLLAFAAGALPLVIFTLCWNYLHLQGRGFPLGLYKLYDPTDTMGFGLLKGAGQRLTWGTWGHNPAKALRSLCVYLEHTSQFFLGWPGRLSLAFVLYGFIRSFRDRRRLLLAGVFIALSVGHFFYWATEHVGIGARYWFESMPGLYVLAACGVCDMTRLHPGKNNESSGTGSVSIHHVLVWGVLALLILCNLAAYLPPKLENLHNLNNINARLKTVIGAAHLTNAVVFVQTSGLGDNDGFYMNDPFMRSGPVFARDLGARNGELLAHYPGYKAYHWNHAELKEMTPEEENAKQEP